MLVGMCPLPSTQHVVGVQGVYWLFYYSYFYYTSQEFQKFPELRAIFLGHLLITDILWIWGIPSLVEFCIFKTLFNTK